MYRSKLPTPPWFLSPRPSGRLSHPNSPAFAHGSNSHLRMTIVTPPKMGMGDIALSNLPVYPPRAQPVTPTRKKRNRSMKSSRSTTPGSHLTTFLTDTVPNDPESTLVNGSLPLRPSQPATPSSTQSIKKKRDYKRQKEIHQELPEPTEQYLTQAVEYSHRLKLRRDLLVILDMNGTLGKKKGKGTKTFLKRDGLYHFVKELINCYSVMVWTSATPDKMNQCIKQIFGPEQRDRLVATWARDTLGLSTLEYAANAQVYKRLEFVWNDRAIQATHPNADGKIPNTSTCWDQSNTVLLDDSLLKACAQPYNLLQVLEFENLENDRPGVFTIILNSLEHLSKYDDVSKVLHKWATGAMQDVEWDNFKKSVSGVIKPANISQIDRTRMLREDNFSKKQGHRRKQLQHDAAKKSLPAETIRKAEIRKAKKEAARAASQPSVESIMTQANNDTQFRVETTAGRIDRKIRKAKIAVAAAQPCVKSTDDRAIDRIEILKAEQTAERAAERTAAQSRVQSDAERAAAGLAHSLFLVQSGLLFKKSD